jgi:CBS domain-containing protein
MNVREVMTTNVVAVRPETPLKEVARLLIEYRISGVPVVDEAGAVLGVVSEGDFLALSEPKPGPKNPWLAWLVAGPREAEGHREHIHGTTAGEAMSRPPVTIEAERELREAAHLMTTTKINRLPVIEDGKLVGIVTRADLVRAFARSDEELFEVIRRALRAVDGLRLVAVRDGVAVLSGNVPHAAVKESVRRLVLEIDGVVAVDDRDVSVLESAYA